MKVRVGVVVTVLVTYCVIDFKMLQKIQIDGRSGRQGLVLFEKEFEFIEPEARVILIGNTLGGWLSVVSALRPNHALTVFRAVLSDDSFHRVIDLYPADYIFTKEGYSLDELPNAEYMTTIENPDLFNVQVYRWKGEY